MTPRSHRWTVFAAATVALVAGCGVEVPDDVADRATSTAPTTEANPATTEAPTSDDPLEQALLNNGYEPGEATCGAERLRAELDDDQIDEVIGADDVGEIDPRDAADFADAIDECLEDGG